MILAKVVGTIVTTIRHPHYNNRRLVAVRPLSTPDLLDTTDFIAVDNSHAGVGDTVLVNREGNGARAALNIRGGCINSVIVGIVDSTHVTQ